MTSATRTLVLVAVDEPDENIVESIDGAATGRNHLATSTVLIDLSPTRQDRRGPRLRLRWPRGAPRRSGNRLIVTVVGGRLDRAVSATIGAAPTGLAVDQRYSATERVDHEPIAAAPWRQIDSVVVDPADICLIPADDAPETAITASIDPRFDGD